MASLADHAFREPERAGWNRNACGICRGPRAAHEPEADLRALSWLEQLELGGSMEALAAALGGRPVLMPALAELGKIRRSVRAGRPVRILPPATRRNA